VKSLKAPIIKVNKAKSLKILVQYVFRANFNDTYPLEEKTIPLNELDTESLTWFDPFLGKSKEGKKEIALAHCTDKSFTIIERWEGNTKEFKTDIITDHILCEDYNESMLIAAHISVSYR
jgi:hypothetical protein